MTIDLSPHLSTLTLHEPQVNGNVAIVQLSGTDPAYPALTPFHEAHAAGLVEVIELGNGGSVSEIRATNRGDGLILILEGEVLIGAKQNRTVNTSILLPPRSSTNIPVSCVEQGRWTGKSNDFTPSDQFVTPDMRAKKCLAVFANLEDSGQFLADQGELWDEVSDRMRFCKIRSSTEDFAKIQGAHSDNIDAILPKFPRHPEAVGIIGFIGGRTVGCDIVPEPRVFASYYDRLLKSYALDSAYLHKKGGTGHDYRRFAVEFIAGLGTAKTETFVPPGLGVSVQLRHPAASGSGLLYNQSLIHLGAFAL